MLGCIAVVLLVKVLRVSALLLLLLHFHPARWHRGREPGSQGLKAGELHEGHEALRGQRLVHEQVYGCSNTEDARVQ